MSFNSLSKQLSAVGCVWVMGVGGDVLAYLYKISQAGECWAARVGCLRLSVGSSRCQAQLVVVWRDLHEAKVENPGPCNFSELTQGTYDRTMKNVSCDFLFSASVTKHLIHSSV